jgi:hypothetical protein
MAGVISKLISFFDGSRGLNTKGGEISLRQGGFPDRQLFEDLLATTYLKKSGTDYQDSASFLDIKDKILQKVVGAENLPVIVSGTNTEVSVTNPTELSPFYTYTISSTGGGSGSSVQDVVGKTNGDTLEVNKVNVLNLTSDASFNLPAPSLFNKGKLLIVTQGTSSLYKAEIFGATQGSVIISDSRDVTIFNCVYDEGDGGNWVAISRDDSKVCPIPVIVESTTHIASVNENISANAQSVGNDIEVTIPSSKSEGRMIYIYYPTGSPSSYVVNLTGGYTAELVQGDWFLLRDNGSFWVAIGSSQNTPDLSPYELIANKNVPNGYAGLDSGGKISSSQLPDIAIVDYLGSIASQAAMLGLIGQKGDWCIRTDTGTTFIITGSNPSLIGSWTELAYPAASVANVVGTTDRITVTGGTTKTIDIASTYAGQTSITTLGTIGTGTWQGSDIQDAYIASASVWNSKLQAESAGATLAIDFSSINAGNKGSRLFPTWANNNIISPTSISCAVMQSLNGSSLGQEGLFIYKAGTVGAKGPGWYKIIDGQTTNFDNIILNGTTTIFDTLKIPVFVTGASSLPSVGTSNVSQNIVMFNGGLSINGADYLKPYTPRFWHQYFDQPAVLRFWDTYALGDTTSRTWGTLHQYNRATSNLDIIANITDITGQTHRGRLRIVSGVPTSVTTLKGNFSSIISITGSGSTARFYATLYGIINYETVYGNHTTTSYQGFEWYESVDGSSVGAGGIPNSLTQLDLQATDKGLGLNLVAGNLGTTRNGNIWYDTVTNSFKGVANSSVVSLLSGSLTNNYIPRASSGALENSYIQEITTGGGATRPYPVVTTTPSGTGAFSGYLKWLDNGTSVAGLFIYKPYTNGQGAGWYQILDTQNPSFPALVTSSPAIGMGLSSVTNSTSTLPTNLYTGEVRNLRVGSQLYGLGVFQGGAGFHYLKPFGGNQWEFRSNANSYMRDWDWEIIGANANSGKGGGNNTLSNVSKIGNSTVKFRAMANKNSPYYYLEGVFKVNSSGAITSLEITQPSSNTTAFNAVITDTRIQFTGNDFSVVYVICEKIGGEFYGDLYTTPYQNERYSADATVKYWAGSGGMGIGVTTQNTNTLLQVDSTTKGFQPPRMTTTQRDAVSWNGTTDKGMIIYNTTTDKHQGWNGTTWNDMY